MEGATDVIYRTMAECGLTHDEGPDVGGPVAPISRQSAGTYQPYAHLLVEKGHAYYCFCERPSPRRTPVTLTGPTTPAV